MAGIDDPNGEIRMDIDDKETKDTDKKTEMDTNTMEQLCKIHLTPRFRCACTRSHPPGLEGQTRGNGTTSSAASGYQTAAPATPVHPQTVQDPLHTDLSQALQATDSTIQQQESYAATTRTTTARDLDAQHMFSYYVEAEITRSSELITAAQTTPGKTRAEIPTWNTL